MNNFFFGILLLIAVNAFAMPERREAAACESYESTYQSPWGFVPDFDYMKSLILSKKISSGNTHYTFALNSKRYFARIWNSNFDNTDFENIEICKKKCVPLDFRKKNQDLSVRLLYMYRPVDSSVTNFELVGNQQQYFTVSCSDDKKTVAWGTGDRKWRREEWIFSHGYLAHILFEDNRFNCIEGCKLNKDDSWIYNRNLIPLLFDSKNFWRPFSN
jgi:hypothetical protein